MRANGGFPSLMSLRPWWEATGRANTGTTSRRKEALVFYHGIHGIHRRDPFLCVLRERLRVWRSLISGGGKTAVSADPLW
jgi:hypothetical protein